MEKSDIDFVNNVAQEAVMRLYGVIGGKTDGKAGYDENIFSFLPRTGGKSICTDKTGIILIKQGAE